MEETHLTEIYGKSVDVLRLYLEKLELLTPREREIISYAIDCMNRPILVSK